MDRQIIYVGQIPQDTDQLLQSKNTMISLGYLMQAVLGTNTLVDGLACTPTGPATMTVNVAGGSIYAQEEIDATAYGSLAADTTDLIVKQGIVIPTTNFSCPAPGTSGQSVVYLVEAIYQDVDAGSTTLPYFNASNPASPYSGPNNTGVSQNTVRQGVCHLALKTGVAATTGTQVTPSPDAGYVGLWAITVANGQSTITSPNIVSVPGAPFITYKLIQRLASGNNLSDVASVSAARTNLGLANVFLTAKETVISSSGTYTPSTGMQYALVRIVGAGGGGGGGHDTTGSGGAGGSGGGYAEKVFTAATIGASQTVTIGAGGTAGTHGTPGTSGGNGGTTSFGALMSATGGTGGGYGPSTNSPTPSSGGAGSGGTFNTAGSAGQVGFAASSANTFCFGGVGGASAFGGGGVGGNQVSGLGGAGSTGAGGGAATGNNNGGAGGNGACIIIEYCNQ